MKLLENISVSAREKGNKELCCFKEKYTPIFLPTCWLWQVIDFSVIVPWFLLLLGGTESFILVVPL